MQNKCKKFRLWSILLLVMLMAAGFTCHSTSRDVQAATKNGFRTVKGKTYYYKNGKKVKGWLTLNGKKYYFSKSTGVQAKGWMKDKEKALFHEAKQVLYVELDGFNLRDSNKYFCTINRIHEDKVLKLWKDLATSYLSGAFTGF